MVRRDEEIFSCRLWVWKSLQTFSGGSLVRHRAWAVPDGVLSGIPTLVMGTVRELEGPGS